MTHPMYGDEIRKARQARGMTQAAVAELAGVSRKQLQLIEENRNVSVQTLLKVLDELDLTEVSAGRVRLRAPSEATAADVGKASELAHELARGVRELLHVLTGETAEENRPLDEARKKEALAAIAPSGLPSAMDEPLADILAVPEGPFRVPSLRVVTDDWVDVLVEGRVAAGPPIDYAGHETVRVPPDQAPQPAWRVLEAWGDSMIEFDIESGDLVYVEPRIGGVAATEEIVIGWLNDGLVIKEWFHKRKIRKLISRNSDIPPRELTPDDFWELRAIVRKVIKRPRTREISFPNISGKGARL